MQNSPDRSQLLQHYFKLSALSGVNPKRSFFPTAPEERIRNKKHRYLRLANYTKRMVSLTDCASIPNSIILVFDSSGMVLESWSNAAPPAFPGPGLSRGDIWSASQIGANAVTIGMSEKIPFYSVGTENYNQSLQRYAVYFSPIQVRSDGAKRANWVDGGIAIILPAEQADIAFLPFVRVMALELIMHLNHFQTSYWFYQRIGQVSITVSTGFAGEPNVITHFDPKVFDLLDLEHTDLFGKPLSAVFDPLPANEEFWHIMEEKRDISGYEIELTTNGKKTTCIISTYAHVQPMIDSDGVDLVITTRKNMTTQIGSQIGNTALFSFSDIITGSQVFRNVIHRARLIANTSCNIMLLGESGVGKDLFAQAIHNASDRRSRPFIIVNCGAIPRDLIASELFGYDPGAFTGAKKQGNIGKFELANGGTIFLDEIGELPIDLQATLLRIVEQKQLQRIGSSKTINIDVKIISATNADIPQMIENKAFRADLYFRLSTMQLQIPPLRERDDDVLTLADHFIKKISERLGREMSPQLSGDAKAILMQHDWPGNVRELQNLVERVLQLYPDSVILPQHVLDNINPIYTMRSNPAYPIYRPVPAPSSLPSDPAPAPSYDRPVSGISPAGYSVPPAEHLPAPNDIPPAGTSTPADLPTGLTEEDLKLLKKNEPLTLAQILQALKVCNNNRTKAAGYLGVSRKTLYRYLERFGSEF